MMSEHKSFCHEYCTVHSLVLASLLLDILMIEKEETAWLGPGCERRSVAFFYQEVNIQAI